MEFPPRFGSITSVCVPLALSNSQSNSPNRAPFVALIDNQAEAMAAIQIAPTSSSFHFPSCQTPPRNPPPSLATETTSAAPCSPTPSHKCSTNQSSSQAVVEVAQQFMEILKSINTKKGPPPSSTPSDTAARASKLEYKTVNEV